MSYYLALFFALGAAFMTWKAVQLWKDADLVDDFMDTFAFLPFGKDVRRGEARSVGLTVVSLWAIAAMLSLPVLDPGLSGAGMYVVVGSVVIILAALLCEVSVVLFNHPKFVVPPHMRRDRGVLTARRERRTSRSRRTR